MKFKGIEKKFNFFNIVNYYKPLFYNIFFFKFLEKKRELLKKSYKSDVLISNFFPNSKNFENFRNIFFNKQIFAYSNDSEKNKIIEFINKFCSKDVSNFVKYADKVLKKEFLIFEKNITFKKKVNWYYGFSKDFSWKLDESKKINIYPHNIDVKYVWEFNRHQFLIYLGFAYYFTKDEKYSKEFKNIILDWIKKNPPLYGINWYSGLEISIRLISWIFALYFFKDSKEVDNEDFFKKIFLSMFQHAYYLRYFYSRRSFNHTVGDIFGLYLFSKIFEEIKPFNRWERKFFNKFKKQILLQTRSDGIALEQSINYHKFILEFFSIFLILNPNAINGKEWNQINEMYTYLLYSIKPNCNFPQIGDSDDGKILLLTLFEEFPFINLINLGVILFQRADLKYISKKISPISLLLLGTKALEIYDKIKAEEPHTKLKYFEKTGYILIRNNWWDNANYLFVDYGRFGPQYAHHSHSSITSFIFSYKGKDIIIDSGTYSYNKSFSERNYFRGSKAHNLLTINDNNQAKIKTRFFWENKPAIKRLLDFNENEIKLTCYHDGYKGYIVKRVIITNMALNNIIIKDLVFKSQNSSINEHCSVDIYFHFMDDINIEVDKNKAIIDKELCLEVSTKQKFTMNLVSSFFSPNYGIKMKNNTLIIHLENSIDNRDCFMVETEIKVL